MKYDINKELTRGAKRTLNDFKTMMFTLLSEKSFEEITVGELCKRANYPRATFYNYFEDKFDLLNYCWLWLTKEIHLEDYQYLPHDKTLHIFFVFLIIIFVLLVIRIECLIQMNKYAYWDVRHFLYHPMTFPDPSSSTV